MCRHQRLSSVPDMIEFDDVKVLSNVVGDGMKSGVRGARIGAVQPYRR
jgi:hypothetical protein